MAPLMIQIKKLEYKNPDAASKLIKYITRIGCTEDKSKELLSYGFNFGSTYPKSLQEVICEFEYVQKYYKTQGSLMCHYVIQISPEQYQLMNNGLNILNCYARECCDYLFHMGFQACYAIHYSEAMRLHIHLAINTTNFATGYKLRQYPAEIKKIVEYPLIGLFEKYTYATTSFPATC